jgi:hypothetical protein
VQSAGQIGAAVGLAIAVTVCTAHGEAGADAVGDGVAHSALTGTMLPIFTIAALTMVPALANALFGFRSSRSSR